MSSTGNMTPSGIQRDGKKAPRKPRHRVAKMQMDVCTYWQVAQPYMVVQPNYQLQIEQKPHMCVSQARMSFAVTEDRARDFKIPKTPPQAFDIVRRGAMPAIVFTNDRVELQ